MHTLHGTIIKGCVVTHVIDGKTLRVRLNPDGGLQRTASGDGWKSSLVVPSAPGVKTPPEETDADVNDPETWECCDVRLIHVDCEESNEQKDADKPFKVVTPAGSEAFAWLKKRLNAESDGRCFDVVVDLEFDTFELEVPVARAREMFSDKYARPMCYVWKDGENVNVSCVLAGQSAYFTKYGRSALYHGDFVDAARNAFENERGIWSPDIRAMQTFSFWLEWCRDYGMLTHWWRARELFIEDFRHFGHLGLTNDVFLPKDFAHYEKLVAMAHAHSEDKVTILLDLQPSQAGLVDGVFNLVRYDQGTGLCVFAGSKRHPLNLWIDNASAPESIRVQKFLHDRYCGFTNNNYVFVTGKLFMYKRKSRPQMLIESCDQFSDLPPGIAPNELSKRLREHRRLAGEPAKKKSSAA